MAARYKLAMALVFTGFILLLAHEAYCCHLFHGNVMDDAYISFRYADNLARGEGLVYNPGEYVEGYSNFLWTVTLAPFARAWDLTGVSILIGVIFTVLTVVIAIYFLRRIFKVRSWVACIILFLFMATSGYYVSWSVSGLETALFGFLLLAGWGRYCVEEEGGFESFPWSAVIFALVALSRPEGIFIALGAGFYHVVVAYLKSAKLVSRKILRLPVIILAVISAFMLFRFLYYGFQFFPNTVYAKTGVSLEQFNRGFDYVIDKFFYPYALMFAPLVFLWHERERGGVIMGWGMVTGYVGFVVLSGGDWSEGRFFAPLVPLLSLLAVGTPAGNSYLVRLWKKLYLRVPATIIVLVYIAGVFYVTGPEREYFFRWRFAGKDAERIKIGRWLRAEAPEDMKIAVFAAGQIPYYSKLYTHDMLGLCDDHIASLEMKCMGKGLAGHEKYDADYTLVEVRPHVIIDGCHVPGMDAHSVYRNSYRRHGKFTANKVYVRKDVFRNFAGK